MEIGKRREKKGTRGGFNTRDILAVGQDFDFLSGGGSFRGEIDDQASVVNSEHIIMVDLETVTSATNLHKRSSKHLFYHIEAKAERGAIGPNSPQQLHTDSCMSTSLSLTQRWLAKESARYPQKDRVYADVDAALLEYNGLRPKTDVYSP
jgi:hypothetical protein